MIYVHPENRYVLQKGSFEKSIHTPFFLVGGDDSPYLELIAVNHQKCYDSIFTILHIEKEF